MSDLSNDEILIDIQNLTFSRGPRKIFDDFSLKIPRNKITAIMGPSGTGKTTLLKLIAGQLKPDSGRILVNDQDVHRLSRNELYALRQNLGMLFQSGALLTDLNVYDNVAFPLREHTDLSEPLIRALVLMKLQAVGLRGAQHLKPSELSGGMARRVALARAMVLDPEMIFYDEPFVGQDPITMGVLVALIKKMSDSLPELTSVVVSHDVDEVLSIADYVCVMSGGKVVAQGDKEAVVASDSPFVKQFIHGLPDGPVPYHYPAVDYLQDVQAVESR
jgi:phospholipid/cholesterol/gamma-HCH transport system ATP-binding protein